MLRPVVMLLIGLLINFLCGAPAAAPAQSPQKLTVNNAASQRAHSALRTPHPALPSLRLAITPSTATLRGARSEQRLLVTAELPGGVVKDVTDAAQIAVTPAGAAHV